MPKRPPGLAALAEPAQNENKGMKITDTMTLVIAGSDGREMRVKESGLKPDGAQAQPAGGSSSSRPRQPKVVSVFGKITFEDLRIGELLGQGSQGRVRKVLHRLTNETYALKSIAFSDDNEETRVALQQELVRIEALKHPNVVSSYEAYFREGRLYVLMELMDAGTITTVSKKRQSGFPEEKVAYIALQFLRGLAHLHASNVVHRDIKPANLLVNSRGEVKIADFGVAGDSSKMHMTSVGSTPYMSPERIKSLPYSTSCDIWSAGMTFAEMAMGTYPFGDVKGKVFDLCQLIASSNVTPKWELVPDIAFSTELKSFVQLCLSPVDKRPTANELLSHPFVAKGKALSHENMGAWFMNPVA
jgi:mitogen-activated protein kinase kinase 1